MKSIKLAVPLVLGSLVSTTLSLTLYAGNPASVEYVDTQDNEIQATIDALIPDSPSKKTVNGLNNGNPASVQYVDQQDKLLKDQIDAITPYVPYEIGQQLVDDNSIVWGIVIYVDPDPQKSGYLALATSDQLLTSPYAWANSDLNTIEVGAGKYGMYGGVNAPGGNMAAYCDQDDAHCDAVVATSAFGGCNNFHAGGYSDWYLPSISELSLMLQNLQRAIYGTDSSVDHALSSHLNDDPSTSYWSSTENNGYGVGPSAAPDTQALYLDMATGTEGAAAKSTLYSVTCVRAIPL